MTESKTCYLGDQLVSVCCGRAVVLLLTYFRQIPSDNCGGDLSPCWKTTDRTTRLHMLLGWKTFCCPSYIQWNLCNIVWTSRIQHSSWCITKNTIIIYKHYRYKCRRLCELFTVYIAVKQSKDINLEFTVFIHCNVAGFQVLQNTMQCKTRKRSKSSNLSEARKNPAFYNKTIQMWHITFTCTAS